MAKNNFDETVGALFHGLDQVLSTKTVVGEPQVIGDTIIVPLMDVSFGMGAGAFNKEKKDTGAGGIGGKMSPSAVLVIRDGQTRIVNVKSQDTVTKVLDMVPDAVNKVSSLIKNRGGNGDSPEVEEAIDASVHAEVKREEIKNN